MPEKELTIEKLEAMVDEVKGAATRLIEKPLPTNGKAALRIVPVEPLSAEFLSPPFPVFPAEKCIPHSRFIEDYVDYANGFTDGPIQFKTMVALHILSIVARDKFFFYQAGSRMFLNLSSLLLGPTTFTRKTTSGNLVKAMTKKVDPDFFLASDFTTEGLIEALYERQQEIGGSATGFLYFSEMAAYLMGARKNWNLGSEQFVADLHDAGEIKRTTRKVKHHLEHPVVNIVSCSTPEWVREHFSAAMLRGGFWGRFLIVLAERPKKEDIVVWQNVHPDFQKEALLVEHIKKIHSLGCEFTFEEGFEPAYVAWFNSMYDSFQTGKVSPGLEGASARTPYNYLKLAALFELSKNPASKAISVESGYRAGVFMDYILEVLLYLAASEFGSEKKKKLFALHQFIAGEFSRNGKKVLNRKPLNKWAANNDIDAVELDSLLEDLAINGAFSISGYHEYNRRKVITQIELTEGQT
jgi:hypothetical protein